jgi:hypothetical protein
MPGERTMKTLRNLFTRKPNSNGRFDRYYGRIARAGAGYPTADEARRDMRSQDRTMITIGMPR